MPEYLAPGVYVEETSFRAKTIEGVSTSTAGFVGPTRTGPVSGVPEIVTSFGEFERVYGGLDPLAFENAALPMPNYLAQGVRAFFENGGQRLYISRVYETGAGGDGLATATVTGAGGGAYRTLSVSSRYPGAAQMRVTFTLRFGQNVLVQSAAGGGPRLRGVSAFDVLFLTDNGAPVGSMDGFHWVERLTTSTDPAGPRWLVRDVVAGTGTSEADLNATTAARPASLSVEVAWFGVDGRVARVEQWDGLGMHADHRRSLTRVFGTSLDSRLQELTIPIVIAAAPAAMTAAEIAATLLDAVPLTSPPRDQFGPAAFSVMLANGSDGNLPAADLYTGDDTDPTAKTGLEALADRQDISIIAAPGYSADGNEAAARDRMMAITQALITHCERMQYRIAVLDSADGQGIGDVRAVRAQMDSSHAALYYPWVRVMDPVTGREIELPPSGFVAGIYARNDIERGVHKAPANEVVRGAIGFELMLNKAQQDVLNPEGINALRWFEGRGYRVWGARTVSSDPEWQYVNLRRYFAYLERSVERGTQWAVFEPNGNALWANIRRTVEDFLYNEWASGRLLGEKPEQAYFVRCDLSTMTQNDLDNGRLICLVGVAPLRPAEFVVFRIGQWTADRPS